MKLSKQSFWYVCRDFTKVAYARCPVATLTSTKVQFLEIRSLIMPVDISKHKEHNILILSETHKRVFESKVIEWGGQKKISHFKG